MPPPKPLDSLIPAGAWPPPEAWAQEQPPPSVTRMLGDVRAWTRRRAPHLVWPSLIVRCGQLLCPPAPERAARREVARVLAAHARARHDPPGDLAWRRREDPWVAIADGVVRHLDSWGSGDVLDAESGLPHLAHAAARCVWIYDVICLGIGEDTRWRGNTHTPARDHASLSSCVLDSSR